MARIRSLKPGFCTSEAIAALSIPCRLHFAMLWTYADDWGRGVDNGRLLKAALWPLDDAVTLEQIEGWQDELHRNQRLLRYVCVDGKRYFEIVNFLEHQRPNRRHESLLPSPADGEQCLSSAQTLFEHNRRTAVDRSTGELRGAVVVEGEGQECALTALPPVDIGAMIRTTKAQLRGTA